MTIKELIEELKKYPGDAKVQIVGNYEDWGDIGEIDCTQEEELSKTVWVYSDIYSG